ncbi:glycine cleavage system H protein [Capsaspora owczarzaki ATCC 30864]|uniref:Glycine cleavage system H protein n=1 Tax=Capsaspora owczarzaki (strain ATCC 30864) TaxID=595528 RepID=A0A0D2WM05_CAPO3|nr:glycine cleavage system H protein [Capsaspora owczarzaki ATCC 30864]KJE91755.1 glycine cleavage system H protein [Capsaspora owczarzaki ATCC 30864]|eukprot:XP_004348659.2 glycine cleavage system H protein [Capsaspora owczarzaki ATCC 30864]
MLSMLVSSRAAVSVRSLGAVARMYSANAAVAPAGLRYTKDHEWVSVKESTATLGITQYAVDSLGDVTFVEFPDVGKKFAAGKAVGVVESVKATSDLYTPVSGEVVEVNKAVSANSSLVNSAPYTEGWLVKMRLSDPKEVEKLFDEAAYKKFCAGLDH